MRVLVIGEGAREHALLWKFKQSSLCKDLFSWPFRQNLSPFIETFPLSGTTAHSSWDEVTDACRKEKIDLVVCGPEAPLAEGIADHFREANILFFGPNSIAAQLETSKSFARQFMEDCRIPSPHYFLATSTQEALEMGKAMLQSTGKCVVKADGLRGGKGVFVCNNAEELQEAVTQTFPLPPNETHCLVEECLEGREVSMFFIVQEHKATFLASAVDFKRLHTGDLGPNTGGMGAYTPVNWLPPSAQDQVHQNIVRPLLQGLTEKDIPYHGFLYIGLMWTRTGPKVIEFNVRMGDPETQALVTTHPTDWLAMIMGQPLKSITDKDLKTPTVCVNVVSPDYATQLNSHDLSNKVEVDPTDLIHICQTHQVQIFCGKIHYNPQKKRFPNPKGRAFTLVSSAPSYHEAREKVYACCQEISRIWPGCQWRTDIAAKAEEGIISDQT
ncbi:MAG: phosphoribosylamine--glycine ligase [Zetaproteobacteria bacterium]|nr:phosphoribosylamine--glycine ligase [Zetaproteobacteria bacterium]